MSPTMWAVILTHDDGSIQDRICFPTTFEESQDEARKLYNDWKQALICRQEANIVA